MKKKIIFLREIISEIRIGLKNYFLSCTSHIQIDNSCVEQTKYNIKNKKLIKTIFMNILKS
ncbi:hypothetical protein PFMALIP_03028 [Plasmodium falciparum MaliPS096_E11]|uniref:Uncharacterized protein n=1 Tax=Plasmodium falciparum MaliPS096_E11 TaxID=1036727 RepID=A0A024WPM3_PLAFA|nr:hypothetical protein PFMALIP_03028 [Plasmodium falciparum MaliPS096_E11]